MEAEDPYAGLTKKEIKRLKKKQKKKGSLMILFQDIMKAIYSINYNPITQN